jgi:hypothetical protein
MLPKIVYILCAATSLFCAVMLARGYWRSGARLLLWSTLCFAALFINNILLLIDKVALPDETELFGLQFPLLRSIFAFLGLAVLLFGLIWDSD